MEFELANKELDILEDQIKKELIHTKNMDKNSDDADAIGAKIENLYAELDSCLLVRGTLEHLKGKEESLEWPRERIYSDIISKLVEGIPLTAVYSYEEKPEEWEENPETPSGIVKINKRWTPLFIRNINVVTKDGERKTKAIYSDIERFKYYDLITNRTIKIYELSEVTSVWGKVQVFLDQAIPIQFPYNPSTDSVKIYIEKFDVALQDGQKPVSTIAFTHFLTDEFDKPQHIMKFFDVTDGNFEELDFKAYKTRRQIFENTVEINVSEKKEEE